MVDTAVPHTTDKSKSTDKPKSNDKPKISLRRRARMFALQLLYAWTVCEQPVSQLKRDLFSKEAPMLDNYGPYDSAFFNRLVDNISQQTATLDETIEPHLDREINHLNPVELNILRLGVYELNHTDTPYKVVLNEMIELAKDFGAIDSHKYVNGVLDKVIKSR